MSATILSADAAKAANIQLTEGYKVCGLCSRWHPTSHQPSQVW